MLKKLTKKDENGVKYTTFVRQISENQIEQYFINQWKKRTKGLTLKFASQFSTGFPDRIAMCWPELYFWVEIKRPGKTATPKQKIRHAQLRALDCQVFVLDTKEKIDKFIDKVLKIVDAL